MSPIPIPKKEEQASSPRFSFRGSQTEKQDQAFSETVKSLIDKSVRKLETVKITDKISKYPSWRDLLESEVLGCGLEDDKVQT